MAKRPPEPEPAEAGTVFIFLKTWNSCQIVYYRPVSRSGAALVLSGGVDLPSLPLLHPEDNQGGCLASYLQHKVWYTCPSRSMRELSSFDLDDLWAGPGVQASTLSYPALIDALSLTYEQGHTLYHARRSLSFITVRIIFLFTDKIKKFPQINIIILLLSKSMIHFRVYRNVHLFTV